MKNINLVLKSLMILSILLFNRAFAGQIVIVKNHQAYANIIIDKNASTQIKNVARILQTYLKKSTGIKLNIENEINPKLTAIHIGLTNFVKSKKISLQNLDQDGYVLESEDLKNFIIVGKTDWGTEFGVYEFLERFVGVRWLMPTELGTDIPNNINLSIPESKIIESPAYLSRMLSPINIENKDPLSQWGRYNKLKKNIEFHHNLYNLFDVKSYSSSNPDFYSTLQSKNSTPLAGDLDWQPNFSAKGISDSAAKKIIKFFSTHPQSNSYSLGMNDSRFFDESSASIKRRNGKKNRLGLEDISDDYYLWANDVAKKVNAIYPNKQFGTLAYRNLIDVPSKTIGVNKNIIPFITNERMRWANPVFKNSDIELSENWMAQANAIGWYDYCYGLSYLVPKVWFHTMQNYLSWGKQHNVKYYYAELYPNWGEGPKAWLLTKLLWNPEQNVDTLLNEWYNRMGGPKAAPKLKSFYSIWEKYWTIDIQKSSWFNIQEPYLKYYDLRYLDNIPLDYITQSDQLINDALKLADSPIKKKRIEELIKMWNVYKLAFFAKQKYNAKTSITLKQSDDFMSALYELQDDSIHNNSVQRILMYVSPTKK